MDVVSFLLGQAKSSQGGSVMHTHNSRSHRGLCMRKHSLGYLMNPSNMILDFYTYGQSLGPKPVFHIPNIIDVDCSRLKAPPPELCYDYTGLDVPLADAFFSIRRNEARFQKALDQIQRFLDKHEDYVGCVAITVSCYYGMHRSVAMAERLATVVERWTRLNVHCKHLDLKRGREKQRKAKAQEHLARKFEKKWPRIGHWIVVWRKLDKDVEDILNGR